MMPYNWHHNFSYSGGEMENIIRKYLMAEISFGKNPIPKESFHFVKLKKWNSSKNTIGF
jgi:hypothetical protein